MKQFVFIFVFCIGLFSASAVDAAYMSPISDLIVDSRPSTSTPHIITFTVTNAVPPSGSFTITPESAFELPVSFSLNDVDFALASGGPYAERNLAASADASFDGVSIVSGSSGSITVTLNSSTGIPAGGQVRVVLGSAASHQVAGSVSPVNPAIPGSYRIRVETYNGGTLIDIAKAMIVVILPVTLTSDVNENFPIVSNAQPSGTIPADSNLIEISFNTDIVATCKFATSTGITYGSMQNTATNIAGLLHYSVVSGHSDGGTYHYYIRCRDQFGATASSDYDLSFTLAPTPTLTSSDGNTPGIPTTGTPGAGGPGGSGDIRGGSSLLFQSSVVISGRAPANSSVTILKDGTQQSSVQASPTGAFSATISSLERGTYTFVSFATDGEARKTSRFSSTLTLNSGTTNAISAVLLSPTVAPDTEQIDIGDDMRLSGIAVPETTVHVLVRDVPAAGQVGVPLEYTASSTATGVWEFTVPAKDLKRGTYEVKVKTVAAETSSQFNAPTYVGVGEAPAAQADTGNRSDINRDGKVNLVDFSILLTHWNDSDPDADINLDDIVNLSDFSILLFNWTG